MHWYRSQLLKSFPSLILYRLASGLDMARSLLKITIRNIMRQKVYSTINIVGLALGMACCFLILLWVLDEVGYDDFHAHADRLHRVVTEQHDSGGATVTAETQYPLAPALKADFSEVEDACRVFTKWGELFVRIGDRFLTEDRVLFVDSSFLRMFTFPLERGKPEEALASPASVVLTPDRAAKYFPGEEAVGQTIRVVYQNRLMDFLVTGILEPPPENSHLRFDLLLPFSTFDALYEGRAPWQTVDNYQTYVLLREDVSFEAFGAKIADYKAKHIPRCRDRLLLQPVPSIHLHSRVKFDSPANGGMRTVTFFVTVGVVILCIACINFMNLATARSARRAKEVGLRKVMGAARKQIVRQFFGESLLLTFLALLVALVLVHAALPGFSALSGKSLSPGEVRDGPAFLILAGIAAFTSLFAGAYPAVYLSGFRPAAVLKGDAANRTAHLRGARFRRLLVIVQFFLSILLMACTLVVSDQLRFLRTKDLGYDRERLIVVPLRGSARAAYGSIKRELWNHPNISGVSAANILPTHRNESMLGEWEGNAGSDEIVVSITSVDYDYFRTMDMEMAQGRPFSPAFPSDLGGSVVVNEEAVRRMGMSDTVGKRVWGRRIVGVVRDYHFTSLHDPIEPIVLSLTDRNFRHLFVNVRSDVPGMLATIREVYERFVPDFPFEFRFLDEILDGFYRTEERVQTLFRVFTVLAMGIAAMGLFGLASFTAEQRKKEIGVRKVLGASAGEIVGMLTGEAVRHVLVANLLAWPAAFFAMRVWLRQFAYRTPLQLSTFLYASVAALVIALLTVSVQSVRAALSDPAVAIQDE